MVIDVDRLQNLIKKIIIVLIMNFPNLGGRKNKSINGQFLVLMIMVFFELWCSKKTYGVRFRLLLSGE